MLQAYALAEPDSDLPMLSQIRRKPSIQGIFIIFWF